jgi:hypothetical protein
VFNVNIKLPFFSGHSIVDSVLGKFERMVAKLNAEWTSSRPTSRATTKLIGYIEQRNDAAARRSAGRGRPRENPEPMGVAGLSHARRASIWLAPSLGRPGMKPGAGGIQVSRLMESCGFP